MSQSDTQQLINNGVESDAAQVAQQHAAPESKPSSGYSALQSRVGNAMLAAAASNGSPSSLGSASALQSGYGNAAVARAFVQRKPEGEPVAGAPDTATQDQAAPAAAQPAVALIVEDTAAALQPGQMKKGDFLAQLKSAVCKATAEELAGTPWSEAGCPYIEQWFTYYGKKSAEHVEQAVRKYAPGAGKATEASAYIGAATARVREAVRKWATTGEMPEGAEGMPGDGAGGAIAGAVSGVAGAVSGAVRSAGEAFSSIAGILFKRREGVVSEGSNAEAIQSQLGRGQSLEGGVRSRMESAFGESFSGVEVHTDGNAAQVSSSLSARALTVGEHIAFAGGEYQPGNPVGEALIAHELAHVVQQRSAGSATQRMERQASEAEGLEEEADESAVSAVAAAWGGRRSGLAGVARNAMPRLKSGLKLQRCKSPEPIPADPHAVYEQKLKEAVGLLKAAGFGLAYKGPDRYDEDYWYVAKDPEFGRNLTLKRGKLPSDAIDAMFSNLGSWKVDCAQFVQVAQWYALRHAFGADEFNRKVKGLSFQLRVHRATGVNQLERYDRSGPGGQMKRYSDGETEPKSVDQLVADAPIGSRVMWTNLNAPTSSAFRNENTIKLGPDSFAAHGFGGDKNTFTRSEVEFKLAEVQWNTEHSDGSSPDAAYISANIFIAQIAIYETP